MSPPDTSPSSPGAWRAWHVVVALACVVVIIAGIRAIAPLVNSLLLAIVLSLMITPILEWFIRHGWPRGLAIAATVTLVIVVGLGLIYVLGVTLARTAARLPDYEENIHSALESLRTWLARWNVDLSNMVSADAIDSAKLIAIAKWLLGALGQLLGGAMLQLLLVVFILIEAPGMRERLSKGAARESELATRVGQITTDIRRYISVVGWLGMLMAVPTTIFLLAMGVEGALLWGALAFLLSFVPAVGFLLSLIPPVLWTLLQYNWERAAIVAVGMIAINSFVDNVIRPRLVGRSLSISPLAIILSLLFWNFVLGPMGALMAIPLTVALKKALLDRFEETRLLAKFIEGGRGEEKPVPDSSK